MKPSDWERVRRLFEAAVDLPASERRDYLTSECGDDRRLMEEVLDLLRADESENIPVDEGLLPFGSLLHTEWGGAEGSRIGPYLVEREIGRGGMGVVYLATRADGVFDRTVALKLLSGAVVPKSMLRRFDNERRVLASLEHPNIARLYDAGVSDEGPYLAMEYVEGRALDMHCDEDSLTVDERIDLFSEICRAVDHAHGRLVLHRDLKPSNILVHIDGTPRLLDFGIAKLLGDVGEEGEGLTRTGLRALTPEYASPEQVRGERLTVASDVFALGVVLYELLTGHRPTADGGILSTPSRIVTQSTADADPTDIARRRRSSPGQLVRRLKGDLDQILLKALAESPEDRYSSAVSLADDLGNFRAGRPVTARAPSRHYRVRKFLRRNAGAVAAAVAVVVALGAGLGVAAAQARIAADERDAAVAAADFLEDLISAPNPAGGEFADTTRLVDFFDVAAERVRTELAGQPRTEARLLATLGRVYQSLGRAELAVPVMRDAVVANREVHGERSEEALEASRRLGMVLSEVGETEESQSILERALGDAEQARASNPLIETRIQETLARTHLNNRRPEEAAPLLEAALASMRQALPPDDPSIGSTVATLAAVSHQLGDFRRAIELQEESLAMAKAGDGPPIRYAISHLNLSMLYMNQGDLDRSLGHGEEGLAIIEDALEEPHWQIAASRLRVGNVLARLDRSVEADSLYVLAIEGFRRTPEGMTNLPYALQDRAQLLRGEGRLAEAEEAMREVVSLLTGQFGPEASVLSNARSVLATVLHELGREAEAESMILASVDALAARDPLDYQALMYATGEYARMLIGRGEFDEASRRLESTLTTAEPVLGPGHPTVVTGRELLEVATGANTPGARP